DRDADTKDRFLKNLYLLLDLAMDSEGKLDAVAAEEYFAIIEFGKERVGEPTSQPNTVLADYYELLKLRTIDDKVERGERLLEFAKKHRGMRVQVPALIDASEALLLSSGLGFASQDDAVRNRVELARRVLWQVLSHHPNHYLHSQ